MPTFCVPCLPILKVRLFFKVLEPFNPIFFQIEWFIDAIIVRHQFVNCFLDRIFSCLASRIIFLCAEGSACTGMPEG